MKKYKIPQGAKEKQQAQKCSCLQTEIKQITKVDLKQYKNHQNITSIDQLEISNDEKYFAIPNLQKEIVGIFNLPERQLIKDVSIKQYNYILQESNKKEIDLHFSVTNEFLIISYYQTVFVVNLKNIQDYRLNLDNQFYQIEGTDQENNLFLTYCQYGANILIYSLETNNIQNQIHRLRSRLDQQIILCSKSILLWETNRWNKLMLLDSGKIVALKSRFYKKNGIFCFDGSQRVKIKNIFNGKIIKIIEMKNNLYNRIKKASNHKNDLLLQIRAEQCNLKKVRYYEIHCFNFEFYEYWPNKVKQLTEKLVVNLAENKQIEFIQY